MKNNKKTWSIHALANLPLSELDISNTLVDDIHAIKKIPFIKLNIANTRISHLNQLNVSRLEYIDLKGSTVIHLGFLENSNIRFLRTSTHKSSIHHLKKCKSLETLIIPKNLYSNKDIKGLNLKAEIIFE